MNSIINEYNNNHYNDYFKLLINLFISGPTTSVTKENFMKNFESNSVEFILLNQISQCGIQIDFSEIKTTTILKNYINLLDQLCKIKSFGISYLDENHEEMMEIIREFHPKFNYPSSYTFSCCTIPTDWFADLLKCNTKLNTLWGIYMCCCRIKKTKYFSLNNNENGEEEEEEEDDDDDEEEKNNKYSLKGIGIISSLFQYTMKLKNLFLSSIYIYISYLIIY